MDILLKYFPDLTERQKERFAALLPLYEEWNAAINVISRKDMEHFYEHHVLHSLAIAEVTSFGPQCRVLDVGTGGGFPGVPLAVMFEDAQFTLVDSVGKKIRVVDDVARRLGLENVTALQARAEELQGRYDCVVSRAVTRLPELVPWVKGKVAGGSIICLKGGDLHDELSPFGRRVRTWDVSEFFDEPWFDGKKVVRLQL